MGDEAVGYDGDATVVSGQGAVVPETLSPAAEDDATLVSTPAAEGDETVPVDSDATVPWVHESSPAPEDGAERTVPVGRTSTRPLRRSKRVMAPPPKRRRGELHPAPVPAGYGDRAVRGSGPGTISSYRARAIPPPPLAGVPGAVAPEVRRITDGAPSVTRRSRRFAAVALGAFAGSCVLSAVGLVLIARAALGL